jgi:hypothetical protein
MMNFYERRVQRMWREKDKEAIKDHTVREYNKAEKVNDRQPPENVIFFPTR